MEWGGVMIEAVADIASVLAVGLGLLAESMRRKWRRADEKQIETARLYAALLNERPNGWASNTPSGVFNAANEHAPVRPPVGRPDKRQRGHNPFSGG